MAKVTYSSTKGLVVSSGTGFQVNDAPILEEIEDVTSGAAPVDAAGHGITRVTTGATGGAESVDVDDGTAAGQLKTIILHVEGNGADSVQVTQGGAAIGGALTAAGDFLHLIWTGSTWAEVGSQRT